jgi:hypothetical protein
MSAGTQTPVGVLLETSATITDEILDLNDRLYVPDIHQRERTEPLVACVADAQGIKRNRTAQATGSIPAATTVRLHHWSAARARAPTPGRLPSTGTT